MPPQQMTPKLILSEYRAAHSKRLHMSVACKHLASLSQDAQNVHAVLHQCSIRIQHEHVGEILRAHQVLIEHPKCRLGPS